jgi:hypothetical protein
MPVIRIKTASTQKKAIFRFLFLGFIACNGKFTLFTPQFVQKELLLSFISPQVGHCHWEIFLIIVFLLSTIVFPPKTY